MGHVSSEQSKASDLTHVAKSYEVVDVIVIEVWSGGGEALSEFQQGFEGGWNRDWDGDE